MTAPDADADRTDYTLASRVTLAALQQREGVRMSLHAAGVTDPHGRALALVAASGTGKTTAARVLGARLGYLSDETVSVGADLSVLAYPKPLSVVIDGDQPHHKSQHGPDELGLLVAPPEATLRGLVLLDRNADHATTGLELLPLDEALELVLPQVSFVTSFDAPLLELTRILQAGGGPWLLRYTEIADHVDDLAALMAAEPGQGESFRHHPGRADAPEGPGGLFARVPWHDAVEVGDSVTVLVAGMSYRLQQLGATVWLALDSPRTSTRSWRPRCCGTGSTRTRRGSCRTPWTRWSARVSSSASRAARRASVRAGCRRPRGGRAAGAGRRCRPRR